MQQVPYHGSATLPNAPTKNGCTFQGWSGNYTYVEQNTTVYALWNSSPVWIKKDDGAWHSYVD